MGVLPIALKNIVIAAPFRIATIPVGLETLPTRTISTEPRAKPAANRFIISAYENAPLRGPSLLWQGEYSSSGHEYHEAVVCAVEAEFHPPECPRY